MRSYYLYSMKVTQIDRHLKKAVGTMAEMLYNNKDDDITLNANNVNKH